MTATRINSAPQFTTRKVTATSVGNLGSKAVVAPAVSGYEFVCWLQAASSGTVRAGYMQDPSQASTNVWNTNTNATTYICTALYVKA